jgi:hypothetical protein
MLPAARSGPRGRGIRSGLFEQPHHGFVGVETQGFRHGPHEAADEAVRCVVERARLEALQRAGRDLRDLRELGQGNAAQAALARQIATDPRLGAGLGSSRR